MFFFLSSRRYKCKNNNLIAHAEENTSKVKVDFVSCLKLHYTEKKKRNIENIQKINRSGIIINSFFEEKKMKISRPIDRMYFLHRRQYTKSYLHL